MTTPITTRRDRRINRIKNFLIQVKPETGMNDKLNIFMIELGLLSVDGEYRGFRNILTSQNQICRLKNGINLYLYNEYETDEIRYLNNIERKLYGCDRGLLRYLCEIVNIE